MTASRVSSSSTMVVIVPFASVGQSTISVMRLGKGESSLSSWHDVNEIKNEKLRIKKGNLTGAFIVQNGIGIHGQEAFAQEVVVLDGQVDEGDARGDVFLEVYKLLVGVVLGVCVLSRE